MPFLTICTQANTASLLLWASQCCSSGPLPVKRCFRHRSSVGQKLYKNQLHQRSVQELTGGASSATPDPPAGRQGTYCPLPKDTHQCLGLWVLLSCAPLMQILEMPLNALLARDHWSYTIQAVSKAEEELASCSVFSCCSWLRTSSASCTRRRSSFSSEATVDCALAKPASTS